jgi:hypothetical protein
MPTNPALVLVREGAGHQRPQQLWAQVSTRQPAPTAFTSPLYVVEPWAPEIYWTIPPGYWPQLHGGALPQPGADCLILVDTYRHRRCVWWAGEYTPPPLAIQAESLT